MSQLESLIKELKERILSEGVMDDETQHHEFVTGVHGRKIDFDIIPTGSSLYELWVDALEAFIREKYDPMPEMLVGVANGANRLALSLASRLDGVIGLPTDKETSRSVMLSKVGVDMISSYKPEHVLVLEDVGTSGTSSMTAVTAVLAAGAQKVTVLNSWQRSETLPKIEDEGIEHDALIKEVFVNYQPDDCPENGYCAKGSKFIPHD